MAVNRYAKKVQQKNEQAENQATNALKDMSTYLNDGIEGSSEIQELSLKNIKVNPSNDYRQLDEQEDIEVLADDIERNGLLHNLVVSKRKTGEYIILSGERRFKALNILMDRELEKQKMGDLSADVGKYRQIPCRVISDLSERKEQIILDAANLQTRGGAGDEKLTRMAMERYRDNVKEEYGLSETQARELLFKITNIGRSSIFRNFRIIDELIPELQDLLNKDEINKKEADSFLKLTKEQQAGVNQAILTFKANSNQNSDNYYKHRKMLLDELLKATEAKTEKLATEKIEKILAGVKEIKREESTAKTEQTIKAIEKMSYRDKVIKECNDIHSKISKLKKKKIDKIKEIDSVASSENETILSHIDCLIKELEEFRKEIAEE